MDKDKIPTKKEKEALKSWSNIGSPGLAQTTKFVPADQHKLIAMYQPIKVIVDWWFTEDQFLSIQLGHEAHEMEDKWNIYMDDKNIVHFHRSWTGYETYRFTVQETKDAGRPIKSAPYRVDSFLYEGNKDVYGPKNESDVKDRLYEVLKFVLHSAPLIPIKSLV